MSTHGTQAALSRPRASARRRKPSRDMWAVWTAIAVCFVAGMAPLARAVQVTVVCADLVGAGGVGIRVWPTLKATPEKHSNTMDFRLLQVNWEAERLLEGDWVGVFEDDPRPPHLRPPATSMPPIHTREWRAPQPLFWDTPFATLGTITTNYTQPRVELSVLARGGCVGPYVGFVRNGVCMAAECLASHPTWLYDHRAVLGSRSLRSLVLPGTHNAGSYSLADDNEVVASWVVCQDEDIISQLLYGNRYLDLRVAYYPDTPELLWINHDLVRWRPLQEVLDDVRAFLALSPDPLIIDIHRTPVGFKLPEALELLLSLMNTTLGGHFVPNRHGPHVTLDDLWQMGKRVVFTFIDPSVSDHTPWVWPPLPQAWANAQLLDDLRTFLDAEMNKRFESPRLWAAMAHLTPTLWDLLFRSQLGVRGFADRVNFSITRWLRQRWGHMANIVASDFFRGNDIINVAIRTNLALSMCRPSDPSRHPYTLRWTTELALRPSSPSTTIPPFVRRMYSGGTLWSTTGVRQIHYPFIPVDANISMVFTAIPNRVPSVAPGVTYQDNGDTWREIFHYPTDGSPRPPEAAAPRPDSHIDSSLTLSSPLAAESSPKASAETIRAEWDESDGQHFLDQASSGGMRDSAPASVTDSLGLVQSKTQDPLPLPYEEHIHLRFGPRESDAIEPLVIQNDSVTAPLPVPRDFSNNERDYDYDAFSNTNSTSSTSNATLDQRQPVGPGHGSLPPKGGGSKEDVLMLLTGNTQHHEDSSLFLSNDTLDNYSLSATNNDTKNSSQSSMIIPAQDGYFSSSADTTLQNSSLQLTGNDTQDSSYLHASDNVEAISHSPLVEDDVLMASPTLWLPRGQSQGGGARWVGDGTIQESWQSDSDVPGTEPINDPSANDFFVMPRHQALGRSTEEPQVSKPSTKQVDLRTVRANILTLRAQSGISTASTVSVQPGTTKVQPNIPTFRIQSGAPTASTVSVQGGTPEVQPNIPTFGAQSGISTASTVSVQGGTPEVQPNISTFRSQSGAPTASTVNVQSDTPKAQPNISTFRSQSGAPTASTVNVQSGTSKVQPSIPAFKTQSGVPTLRVQPSTSTVRVQPTDASLTAHLGVFDLTATKSSSQVT